MMYFVYFLLFIKFSFTTSNLGKYCGIESNPNLKSIPQGGALKEVLLVLNNVGDTKIDVVYVDLDYSEHILTTINPHDQGVFNTYVGHAWRVKTKESGTVIFETTITLAQGPNVEFEIGRGCLNEDLVISDDPNILDTFDKLATFRVDENFERIYMPASEWQMNKVYEDIPCLDILNWISRVLIVPGYHVLCISSAGDKADAGGPRIQVDGWRNGHDFIPDDVKQTFVGRNMSSFREYLESILDIERTDRWHDRTSTRQYIRFQNHGVKNESMPQKWKLFTTTGNIIKSFDTIQKAENMIALVFEGGQFIYPGIEAGFRRKLFVYDREVTLETLSLRPLVFSIDSFLLKSEYTHIIKRAEPYMERSEVSLMDKHKSKSAKDFRTSSTYFLPSKGDQMLERIDERVARLTHCPVNQQEDAQVLKYEVGERYLGHHDFWNPEVYSKSEDVLMNTNHGHRNRLATVLWYMSDCDGGYTAFPDAPTTRLLLSPSLGDLRRDGLNEENCPHDFRVPPVAGKAILFYSLLPNGDGDELSTHASCPVTAGTKWSANKWVWNDVRPE